MNRYSANVAQVTIFEIYQSNSTVSMPQNADTVLCAYSLCKDPEAVFVKYVTKSYVCLSTYYKDNRVTTWVHVHVRTNSPSVFTLHDSER